MEDQFLYGLILRGEIDYDNAIIHKIYTIEDLDRRWQLVNYKRVTDAYDSLERDNQ